MVRADGGQAEGGEGEEEEAGAGELAAGWVCGQGSRCVEGGRTSGPR